jgi:hypothetical protein
VGQIMGQLDALLLSICFCYLVGGHPLRQITVAKRYNYTVLLCFEHPGHLDRVQQGKAKLDGYPVPPDPRLS